MTNSISPPAESIPPVWYRRTPTSLPAFHVSPSNARSQPTHPTAHNRGTYEPLQALMNLTQHTQPAGRARGSRPITTWAAGPAARPQTPTETVRCARPRCRSPTLRSAVPAPVPARRPAGKTCDMSAGREDRRGAKRCEKYRYRTGERRAAGTAR